MYSHRIIRYSTVLPEVTGVTAVIHIWRKSENCPPMVDTVDHFTPLAILAKMSRSSEFLKCFWDLAADDITVRLQAVDRIVHHLEGNAHQDDFDYSIKRLVKGLSSSRESARLGFSTCLTCMLIKYPKMISMETILTYSDEYTQITGSAKGMDERDMMFGKIFCYLSILRSGRLNENTNANLALSVLDKIIEIHELRGWIREVTVEAMHSFLAATHSNHGILKGAFERIGNMVTDPVGELSAWQIVLLMGLRPWLSSLPSTLRSKCDDLDFHSDPKQILDSISETLLSATSGFPKIHRIWEFLIGEIVSLDEQRMLPTTRYCTFYS